MKLLIVTLAMLSMVAFVCPCCAKEVKADDYPKSITRTYQVEGMTCGGCEVGVRLALKKAGFGKTILSVSHKEGNVVMQFDSNDFGKDTDCKVIKSIQAKGYAAYADSSKKNICP